MNTVELVRPAAYRQSLIAAFDSCPLRAKFALEDPRRTPSAIAARGTLLHRAMHQATRLMQANGERRFSVEQGMELLTAVLSQMRSEVESGEVVPIPMKEMRWARVIMVKWCEYVDLDPSRIVGIEERYTAPLELPTGRTVDVTGQMDLILSDPPSGITVVDWKSGFRRPKVTRTGGDPLKESNAEFEGTGLTELGWVQNLVYSYIALKKIPWLEYVNFREVHVLRQEERQAKTNRFKMEQLQDVLASQVSLLDQAIEEGSESERWTPSAGPHCAMCAKPWACPIMKMEEIELHTEAGRRRVAHEWVVAGQVRKEREEFLKGIADVYGPQEVVHSDGRRVVGWDMEKKRFGLYEPYDVPESPWDQVLEKTGREAGVLADDNGIPLS